MNETEHENADAVRPPADTDAELAWKAAELATAWVSASTRLTEDQGWHLVGLQHMGSAQGEEYAWRKVHAWERQLAEVLAADDGSEESRLRVTKARQAAAMTMRDMLLAGIPAEDDTNQARCDTNGYDPRMYLRSFVKVQTARDA